MEKSTLRKATYILAVLSPFVPWVYGSYGDNVTVFFSFGFLDFVTNTAPGLPRHQIHFVDIYSYTFDLTNGAFTGFYWFWHIALLLTVLGIVTLYLGRRRISGLLFVVASLGVLRLTMGLGRPPQGFVVPVGLPWLLVTGLMVFYRHRLTDNPTT